MLLRFIVVVTMSGAGALWETPANKKAAANYFEHFLPATLSECTLCHLPSEYHSPHSLEDFPHNAFGKELAAIKKMSLPQRLELVAEKDSDHDGVANLTEILLGGHPGDARVKPTSDQLAQWSSKKQAFDTFLERYPWEPFKLVKRPAIPAQGASKAIDGFIDERLAVHDLKPLGEAAPAQIARRVYVDLTGLLPTPEQGVRFVQLFHGYSGSAGRWDHHKDIAKLMPPMCAEIDQPIAGLIHDLKQRGMLDETLVVWGTEFGRTPGAEFRDKNVSGSGRDHHPHGFTCLMAGGGVKGGFVHGATDELGFHAVEGRQYVTDLHATVLHQLGLNHHMMVPGRQRLERDFGNVINEILV